jgi:ATP-dependent DNA helicase RecG
MLTETELLTLLTNLESDRVERTVSTKDREKFAEAVCAFANDMPGHRTPGYLLIGVDDDGQPSGIDVTDALLQQLAGLRSDGNILPIPAISVAKFVLNGAAVAVVEVQPHDLPPVRYKGRVWIRVGPRRAIASEHEERILSERRVASARPFDATAVTEATVNDLSLGLFEAYRPSVVDPLVIAENHCSRTEQLASLRFLDARSQAPTVTGILMFGKNPRFFLRGAYVQFLRLPGKELVDLPVDQAEISGDLQSVLRELELRVKVNIQSSLEKLSILQERLTPDYPEIAVRELLLNAIMHRDYQSNAPVRFYWFADRIEIQSPGGLYGRVTKETLTKNNDYRNPTIAECMKALGYVNRFGYGIQRAQKLLQDNDNPPAEFDDHHASFLTIIRRRTPER